MILNYCLKRAVEIVLVLWLLSIIVFLLIRLLPGDPAQVIAGLGATADEVEALRVKLGLHLPFYVQYVRWLGSVFKGDLGSSAITGEAINKLIIYRLWNTTKLAIIGLFLAVVLGIVFGTLSAVYHNTIIDYGLTVIATIGISMPIFMIGLFLMWLFALRWQVLPAAGTGGLRYIILPSLTIAGYSTPFIVRMTRASLLEVLRQDFIRTAEAKGLASHQVIVIHGLRNAAVEIITVIGLQFGTLMGGAVLTESVFDWSGLGRLLVDAVFKRDYPLVQGLLLIFGGIFAFTNFLVDITYGFLDPRVVYE
ncbi:MAG: ABC transporter permease [Candidatus Hadarchaeum sp.]|uniref:ABC transporter permease n=1 Tax=Candidatus Hadarchaeum sp. TaxID=2883567 RepID=UPI003174EAE2